MSVDVVEAFVENIRRSDRTAGAYTLVELDLVAQGFKPDHPGVTFVREQAERANADFDRAKEVLKAAQAKCSHAFERPGAAPAETRGLAAVSPSATGHEATPHEWLRIRAVA